MRGLSSRSRIALFLDYDGTLTPIVEEPSQAKLSEGMKEVLSRLLESPRFRVSILSGRGLADLKERVGLSNIYYSGCHGLIIEAPGFRFIEPVAESTQKDMKRLARRLKVLTEGISGCLVEEKEVTVALHYRLVAQGMVSELKRIFTRAVKEFDGRLRTILGRGVFEALPNTGWDKGDVVARLLEVFNAGQNQPWFPVYLGDDLTDEPAFELIGKRGVTIRVGRSRRTAARYRLRSPKEVEAFLKSLLTATM